MRTRAPVIRRWNDPFDAGRARRAQAAGGGAGAAGIRAGGSSGGGGRWRDVMPPPAGPDASSTGGGDPVAPRKPRYRPSEDVPGVRWPGMESVSMGIRNALI